MRSAVGVVMAGFTLSSGCTQYAIKKSTHVDEHVEQRPYIGNGSEVRVRVVASDDQALLLAVEEVPLCRPAVQGRARRIDITDRRKRPSQDTVRLLALLGAGLVGATVILWSKAGVSATDCGLEPDLSWGCTEHRNAAFGVGMFGLSVGGLLMTPMAVHPLRADEIHTEDANEWERLSRWDGPPELCKERTPAPLANHQVLVKAKYNATEMATLGLTGPDGMVKVRTTPGLVAAVCGAGSVEVSVGAHSEENDSPDRPTTSAWRPGAPATLPVTPRSGTWSDIAAAGAIELAAAQQCCIAANQDSFTGTCTTECADAGNSGRCLDALGACKAKASSSEDPSFGRTVCEELFEECLAVHGSSLSNLRSCTKTCSREKARQLCDKV